MTTASSKGKKKGPKKVINKSGRQWEDLRGLIDRFDTCNLHGIKDRKYWSLPNRFEATFFLMPEPSLRYALIDDDVSNGVIIAEGEHFTRFWHELADSHKERRFLADYMAALRYFLILYDKQDEPGQEIKRKIFTCLSDEIFWKFRYMYIAEPKTTGLSEVAVRIIREVYEERPMSGFLKYVFTDALALAFRLLAEHHANYRVALSFDTIIGFVSMIMVESTVIALNKSYFGWVSFDTAVLQRYLKGKTALIDFIPGIFQSSQSQFMKKMKVAVPHWCKDDRAFIHNAIETSGDSCRGSYVDRLLKVVGLDKFKRLVFGKEKFCANCGRSSYVAEDRMWCCKLCSDEHTRPKARYCNAKCQKAHWVKHKELHSTKKKQKPATIQVSAAYWPGRGGIFFESRSKQK